MGRERTYFTLSLEPLRAIEAIREFAARGKRTGRLRSLALAAHTARVVGHSAAAAPAAERSASSAYAHPLADVHQTTRIVLLDKPFFYSKVSL